MSESDESVELEEMRTLARSFGKEALMRIVEIMNNATSDNVALKAAFGVLERGYGKSGVVRMQETPFDDSAVDEQEQDLDGASSAERIRVLTEALNAEKRAMLERVELVEEKLG